MTPCIGRYVLKTIQQAASTKISVQHINPRGQYWAVMMMMSACDPAKSYLFSITSNQILNHRADREQSQASLSWIGILEHGIRVLSELQWSSEPSKTHGAPGDGSEAAMHDANHSAACFHLFNNPREKHWHCDQGKVFFKIKTCLIINPCSVNPFCSQSAPNSALSLSLLHMHPHLSVFPLFLCWPMTQLSSHLLMLFYSLRSTCNPHLSLSMHPLDMQAESSHVHMKVFRFPCGNIIKSLGFVT